MFFLFALSANSETTFWEDVWNYLYDVYLRVDGNYQNIGLDKMPLFSLRLTVLGIFVGAIIACVAMAYHKQVLGGAVRQLISIGAKDAESAKTAEEMGYGNNFLIRHALCRSVSLRRVVKCVEEEDFYRAQEQERAQNERDRESCRAIPKFKEREYLVDITRDHFYIPEELRIRAELKFEKKGSGWVSTVISIIVLLILFFLLLLVLPQILEIVDGLL